MKSVELSIRTHSFKHDDHIGFLASHQYIPTTYVRVAHSGGTIRAPYSLPSFSHCRVHQVSSAAAEKTRRPRPHRRRKRARTLTLPLLRLRRPSPRSLPPVLHSIVHAV